MTTDLLFHRAMSQLQHGNRLEALSELHALANQKHVPATFAYADALFPVQPKQAIAFLLDKSNEGLLGAALRAVLMKVFFKRLAMEADDVKWLHREALKGLQEALIILVYLSETTSAFDYYVQLMYQRMPNEATLLALPKPKTRQHENCLPPKESFTSIANAFNQPLRITPTINISAAGIVLYQNVFSPLICRHFVLKFESHMQPSMIHDPITGKGVPNNVRTSTYLQVVNNHIDWFALDVERRLAQISGCPVENGEPLSVLQYCAGQEYKPHYDAFVGDEYATSAMLNDGGQRVKTLICYLQSAEQGGETAFSRQGIRINPTPGSVLMFNNTDNDGNLIKASYHSGLPVLKGAKWIMTKWIRANQSLYGKGLYT